MEVSHGGVHKGSEEREEFLEVSEERWVVECPWAGGVGIPAGEGKRVSESQPVTMDLEVCAPVGGD